MGDETDIPKLARHPRQRNRMVSATGRGFGLIPAISLSRAAETTIEKITSRAGPDAPSPDPGNLAVLLMLPRSAKSTRGQGEAVHHCLWPPPAMPIGQVHYPAEPAILKVGQAIPPAMLTTADTHAHTPEPPGAHIPANIASTIVPRPNPITPTNGGAIQAPLVHTYPGPGQGGMPRPRRRHADSNPNSKTDTSKHRAARHQ